MRLAAACWVTLAATMLLAGPLTSQSKPQAALNTEVAEHLASREAALIALRRDLHQHPEVSGAEVRTAGIIAEHLRSLGFEVRSGVGGHGVVGILRGARPGPMVAFRADMDAVRSDFPDPVEFRSLNPGVRHICGHDIHVTVGIGIAEGLAAVRDAIAGSVMLVFQPAEENATGAKAMLGDGVFGSVKPDAIYAVHTAPYPVGQLGTAPGGMMAGRDIVQVTITGPGDLVAAVEAVEKIIAGVSTVPPQMVMQPAPEGFLIAQIFPQADAPAADSRVVRAQITTATTVARARAKAAILASVERLALPDVAFEAVYEERVMAGVTNDSALVTRANARIRTVLGDESVVVVEGVPPAFSEDFGSFQDATPGVMYFLGVSNPAKGTVGMPHSPGYVADDGAIMVGARAMTAVLLEWLVPRE
jgi:amidohydrolase